MTGGGGDFHWEQNTPKSVNYSETFRVSETCKYFQFFQTFRISGTCKYFQFFRTFHVSGTCKYFQFSETCNYFYERKREWRMRMS